MKIVIINGSPREHGLTGSILSVIRDELTKQNAEVEYYNLGSLNMSHCKGCCSCYRTGHCIIDDDAEKISNSISTADGLILGSPTYASNVSGLMKVLIDRGHFVIEQLLHDKHCVTVVTGENYGKNDTNKVLKNLVLYSGGYLTDSICLNAPFNEVTSVSSKTDKIGSRTATKLYFEIKNNKKHPIQILFHKVIFNFGIKPFVLKKGDKYAGVINKWNSNLHAAD